MKPWFKKCLVTQDKCPDSPSSVPRLTACHRHSLGSIKLIADYPLLPIENMDCLPTNLPSDNCFLLGNLYLWTWSGSMRYASQKPVCSSFNPLILPDYLLDSPSRHCWHHHFSALLARRTVILVFFIWFSFSWRLQQLIHLSSKVQNGVNLS